MFYYLFDNLVWIANMGAIYKYLINEKMQWKDVRNGFSLIKNVCESLKSIIRLY